MLSDFLVGASASALTGLALWAFLPRGAALTRRYGDEPDSYVVQNDSPVPVRILAVQWQGVDTMRGDVIEWRTVPAEVSSEDSPVMLRPDHDEQFYKVMDAGWPGFVLPPGDTLAATVMNNRVMRVRYRRAGWTGVFERREINLYGGT